MYQCIIPGLILVMFIFQCNLNAIEDSEKPRILISTDIGGTDPDDNQSMVHYLMYSNRFHTEGLISSPSYGRGNKKEIERMIDLYEQDYPKLQGFSTNFPSPNDLKKVTKQGQSGMAPFSGYQSSTEGSDWIIHCAKKVSKHPLWILVWGGLDDLAQALHDAPDIQHKIKIYWIGGPNKKWSTNSYAYIVEHFPDLWFIEANATYRGFFANTELTGPLSNENFYKYTIEGGGALATDFRQYYNGDLKMGDTPSVLYLLHGDIENPTSASWGGRFQKIRHSPRTLFRRNTTIRDTVSVYSIIEYRFTGPVLEIPLDSPCFSMNVKASIGLQKWPGYYLGGGEYAIRYAPKKAELLTYQMESKIAGFPEQRGQIVVKNLWPGSITPDAYELGDHWYSDLTDPDLFVDDWQGAKTVLRWRSEALRDWAERWQILKD